VNSPPVTVCIPTYNQAAYLRLAVASALSQDYPDVRVIVSDDASTDDTAQVLVELCAGDSRVRAISQPRNLGIAGNTDAVLRAAQTEYVARLDSDDLLHPAYLRTLVSGLERHRQAGYAHASAQEIDQAGQPTRLRLLRRNSGFQSGDEALRAAASGYRVAANILLFRRTSLEQLGYTCGRPNYLEDYDLSVSMAAAGFGNYYSDSILCSYRVWTDIIGVRARRKLMELEGFRHVYEKTLKPFFLAKGWSLKPLVEARRRLARRQAVSAYDPRYSLDEKASIRAALIGLGESPSLHLFLSIARFSLGRKVLDGWHRFDTTLRTRLKRSIRRLRHPKLAASISM